MKPLKNSKPFELRNQNFVNQITESCFNETLNGNPNTCDVVIKCGPEKTEYFCHRIILANASEFLWQALSTTIPGTTPVLLLPDIKPESIKYILSFVYNGSVEVPLTEYSDFHEACLMLGLKGVDQSESNEETEPEIVEEFKTETIEDQNEDETMTTENEFNSDPIQGPFEWKEEEELEIDDSLDEPAPIQGSSYYMPNTQTNMPSFTYSVEIPNIESQNMSEEHPKMMQYDPNIEGELSQPPPINTKWVQPPKNHCIRKSKDDLINFSPEIRQDCLNKAKEKVRNVYVKLDKRVENLEAVINDTKLIVLGNKLLRAEHRCGFCRYPLAIVYTHHPRLGTKWNNGGLTRHLKRIHDIKRVIEHRID